MLDMAPTTPYRCFAADLMPMITASIWLVIYDSRLPPHRSAASMWRCPAYLNTPVTRALKMGRRFFPMIIAKIITYLPHRLAVARRLRVDLFYMLDALQQSYHQCTIIGIQNTCNAVPLPLGHHYRAYCHRDYSIFIADADWSHKWSHRRVVPTPKNTGALLHFSRQPRAVARSRLEASICTCRTLRDYYEHVYWPKQWSILNTPQWILYMQHYNFGLYYCRFEDMVTLTVKLH